MERLLDRAHECRLLDELLDSARQGPSGVLVLRGEAGIGKSALLDYAVEAAPDFLVVRFTGLEPERDIGFAALHRLLMPILHQIARLPVPQRDAMNAALGLDSGQPGNHFLVGLAVVNLAANAVRARQRLLCVIDDSQWVDRESIEALAFWGHRLQADGIALVFAERTGWESASPLDGFVVVEIEGLSDEAARVLIAAQTGFGAGREVADRIVTEARGNPLALVEFAKDSRLDLSVAASELQPLPMSRRLEERFARQARTLPVDTQMLLLLAAADSTARTSLVLRAASVLGVTTDSAAPAEAAGLVTLGSTVAFRHPLIRSAVYGRARPADRRAAHKALAAATDPGEEGDRQAWHLAAATIGQDEEVAALLERRARDTRVRGGHNAAAALLTRSAELSLDPEQSALRRIAAAETALTSGASLQVHALVALAKAALRDPAMAARADRLDGNAWRREAKTAIAAPLLLSAAVALMPTDPRLARQTLLEAIEAVLISGPAAGDELTSAVTGAIKTSPPGDDDLVDTLLNAFGTYLTDGFVAAAPALRVAITTMSSTDLSADRLIRWVQLAIFASRALWDDEAHSTLTARLGGASREPGALMWVAVALKGHATGEVWAGRFDAAEIDLADAAELSIAAGEHPMSLEMIRLEISAIRGRDAQTRQSARTVIDSASELGSGSAALSAHHALLVLELGAGDYNEALGHAHVTMTGRVGAGHQVLADVVEAAIRGGDPDTARDAVDCLAERAPASGTPWAMGLLARCQALLSDDGDAERLYQQAIDLLGASGMAVELARAHLLYGEWLRRQKRRIDARDQLRIAHNTFVDVGADAFANRTRHELLATGEKVRKRNIETFRELTPQEDRIARLAAAGDTNAEIAAKLFIASTTVEYHLRKVFQKLAVTSRRQLKPEIYKLETEPSPP